MESTFSMEKFPHFAVGFWWKNQDASRARIFSWSALDANASFAFENKENVLKVSLKPKQILEFSVLLNIENLDLGELNQRSLQLRLASEDRKSLTNLKLNFATGNSQGHETHFSVKLMLIDCQEKEMFTEHPLYLAVHDEDKLGSPPWECSK